MIVLAGSVMILPTDVLMMGIDCDDDEDREDLGWRVNVANEERIEGEVETGNADLPDHNHDHLYYMPTYYEKAKMKMCTFPGQF
jgi:hypothetical protein